MSKSKFVDAFSEFKNILTMEQKSVVWCFLKQIWFLWNILQKFYDNIKCDISCQTLVPDLNKVLLL